MTGEQQPKGQQDSGFLKKVQERAFFRGQRKSGEVKGPKDANFVQAEEEQLLIDEAAENSRGISKEVFDGRIVPAVDARIKPKTRKIGEVLGRVIGQAKKDKVEIQGLTNKAEDAAKASVDAAKRAENAAKNAGEKSSKKNVPAWIAVGVLGAAAVGLATWGIVHEATENNNSNVSKTHVMDMGETLNVGAGSIVSGDIFVNGTRMFDDSQTTGLVIEFQKEATVTAPWGATVKGGIKDQKLMDTIASQLSSETKRIRPEVTYVDIVTFPGANPQGK